MFLMPRADTTLRTENSINEIPDTFSCDSAFIAVSFLPSSKYFPVKILNPMNPEPYWIHRLMLRSIPEGITSTPPLECKLKLKVLESSEAGSCRCVNFSPHARVTENVDFTYVLLSQKPDVHISHVTLLPNTTAILFGTMLRWRWTNVLYITARTVLSAINAKYSVTQIHNINMTRCSLFRHLVKRNSIPNRFPGSSELAQVFSRFVSAQSNSFTRLCSASPIGRAW
jgi:hypothetical protein